jgi:DNA (cytosine-5)-methyltransferase 1
LETVGAGSVLNGCDSELCNNETREHKAESILRYMRLNYGQRDQLGRVDRLDPMLPSKTVIAGGTKGGGRSHLHPEIPRTLSVRECANLQTFPKDYIFMGANARQFTQVGNAVPPVLAAQIGNSVTESYF